MRVETRKLGPIAQAFYDGFATSTANGNGEDLPLCISWLFDKAVEYAKEHGEEPQTL